MSTKYIDDDAGGVQNCKESWSTYMGTCLHDGWDDHAGWVQNYETTVWILYKVIMDVVDGTTPLVLHYSNTSYTVPDYLIYDLRRMTDTLHYWHGLLVYSSPSQQLKNKKQCLDVWTVPNAHEPKHPPTQFY